MFPNILLRPAFRKRRIVLFTHVSVIFVQPLQIFEQIVPAVGTQLEVVRHHDRFCRAYLGTQIAQDTNFKIDVVRINDLSLFLRSGFGLPTKLIHSVGQMRAH